MAITECEQLYKVVYLGNVLTPWAKGDQSVNRALDTLWLNHLNKKGSGHEIYMRLTICNSGLRAETKQFGLTEYWANRITYCCWRAGHPKLFAWVYRHVGRKGKPELRCHAVLCQKEDQAKRMRVQLEDRLQAALREFLREKVLRQKARLSLTSDIPVRKQLLVKGLANFRPPIERSRSAPKLMAIVEDVEREEEEERELLEQIKRRLKEEEEDFSEELSSISLTTDESEEGSIDVATNGHGRPRRRIRHDSLKGGGIHSCDEEDGDSAIDSDSFKSDEVIYSTSG